MNKASSLFVLILLGSLVADAVAQSNPPRPNQGQHPDQGAGWGSGGVWGQAGGQQGGQHSGGQHSGGQQGGGYNPAPSYPQSGGQYTGGYNPTPSYPQYPSQPSYQPIPTYPQYPQYPSQYPQHPSSSYGQVITQRPMQTIRSYDRLELAHLLRLSMSESMDLEASSITILAQSLRGQASLDIQIRGRSISVPQIVRRDLTQVQILLPTQTRIEDVEILASNDLLLDTISVEAQSVYQPYQQQLARPMAGEVLTLSLSQSIRVSTDLDVVALVRQQLGITLDGSSIERVAIMAHSISGRAGSAQLLINNRIVSNAKTISGVSRSIPLNVSSVETVRGDLRLVVRGDVVITRITIKVGQVRLGY